MQFCRMAPPPGFPPIPPPFAGSPPPGMLPPGVPPFPPGVRPPFPPPPFLPSGVPPPGIAPPGFSPPPGAGMPPVPMPPMPGASSASPPPPVGAPGAGAPPVPLQHAPPSNAQQPLSTAPPPPLVLPNPSLAQVNPPFKKGTVLKWEDANFSPVRRYSLAHVGACAVLMYVHRKRSGLDIRSTISLSRKTRLMARCPTFLQRKCVARNGQGQRTSCRSSSEHSEGARLGRNEAVLRRHRTPTRGCVPTVRPITRYFFTHHLLTHSCLHSRPPTTWLFPATWRRGESMVR